MVDFICPICFQHFKIANHIGDFVHECNTGDKAIDEESVKIIGDYEDFSTDGVVKVDDNWTSTAGIAETNAHTFESVASRGQDVPLFDERGKRADIYRTRPRLFYIKDPSKLPQSIK